MLLVKIYTHNCIFEKICNPNIFPFKPIHESIENLLKARRKIGLIWDIWYLIDISWVFPRTGFGDPPPPPLPPQKSTKLPRARKGPQKQNNRYPLQMLAVKVQYLRVLPICEAGGGGAPRSRGCTARTCSGRASRASPACGRVRFRVRVRVRVLT